MIFAKGVMAESLFLGTQALRNLPRSARQEIRRITKVRSAQVLPVQPLSVQPLSVQPATIKPLPV